MKIAVPWPVLESGQARIREALALWENKKDLALCFILGDKFMQDVDIDVDNDIWRVGMSRNSSDIGTKVPKCYIAEMVEDITILCPNEDWYGFGNSDCVPVGDLLEDAGDKEVLIYHRTDINEWEHRHNPPDHPTELQSRVWKMRQKGVGDKKIARMLNREEVPPPKGSREWTYVNVQNFCSDQGSVFVCGQDLYLFRRDVVQDVLDEYLKVKDPILGTGAFDPRLTRWCMKRFNSARVLHKLFHKKHQSEWNPDEVEFKHNGGMMTADDWPEFLEEEFLISLCDQDQGGALPKWFMQALRKKNKPLWERLVE